MTRRKFLADVQQAKEKPPAHIANVKVYDDEGVSFIYLYLDNDGRQQEVRLNLIVTAIDQYPADSGYIVYTDDPGIHPAIQNSLEQLQAVIGNMSVVDALREISGGLHQAMTLGQTMNPIIIDSDPPILDTTIPGYQIGSHPDAEASPDTSDFEDLDEFAGDSDDNFGFDSEPLSRSAANKQIPQITGTISNIKIKHDLRKAKDAGYKVGSYGDLQGHGIISVSIRMSKLGISDEAMQAWGIFKEQYLVLLIRISHGYRTLSQIKDDRCLVGKTEMRVGICDKYKPEREMSYRAFDSTDDNRLYEAPHTLRDGSPIRTGRLEPSFIGKPLNDLLRDRFVQIIKFRGFGLSWDGAEKLYNDTLGAKTSDLPKDLFLYQSMIDEGISKKAFPAVVKADHLANNDVESVSLPLVAMQFVLRHFVRCTEFCLVCHCKLQDSFEALKPYVCSNQLCLYQFLALGIGPSVEWEIISQPYVVDLLISLCYCQTNVGRLKNFPLGISLKVPLLPRYCELATVHYGRMPLPKPVAQETLPEIKKSFDGKLNYKTNLLMPSTSDECSTLTSKDWIAIVSNAFESVCHYRISERSGNNFYLVNSAFGQPKLKDDDTSQEEWIEVDCYIYNHNFDELPSKYRCASILAMLNALPSVTNVRDQLLKQQAPHRDPELMSLSNIPPAARELMRWIIASNRSCIIQIDKVGDDMPRKSTRISEHRVSGMQDYLQFRFAQGAPDKEQRFVDSIREHTLSSNHPTLFAWHGSPLYNWHSIIREGLNFDEVLHGRANGHGVYMSTHLPTSLSYAMMHQHPVSGMTGSSSVWPNSLLQVSSVISLQEIVNNPPSFVSTHPHLVVAQKEWIQTRYLFVKTLLTPKPAADPEHCYTHDSKYPLMGSKMGEIVKIPLRAASRANKITTLSIPLSSSKKLKTIQNYDYSADDDAASVATLEEDMRLCEIEDNDVNVDCNHDLVEALAVADENYRKPQHSDERKRKTNDLPVILDRTKTDFVPGILDTSNIKILPQPSYATRGASAALRKALAETVKTQKTTPVHEIGYYIDESRIENIYQWIVELHSFDKALPLTKDMKQAGITSIVLEMLFTADFPFSPPFVRVIKPRFLPFLQGGGGHVTEGGAICMELLTSSGWSAVSSIESVLLSIRLAMSEVEHPARLMGTRTKYGDECYAIGDAIAAYRRACMRHGWQTPKGLDDLMKLN